jgi:hypothetical protein
MTAATALTAISALKKLVAKGPVYGRRRRRHASSLLVRALA